MLAGMKAYRAAILSFDPDTGAPRYWSDGLLVTGPGQGGPAAPRVVLALGPFHELIHRYPGLGVESLPDRLIAPGFVDLHVHYPQTDVIGWTATAMGGGSTRRFRFTKCIWDPGRACPRTTTAS